VNPSPIRVVIADDNQHYRRTLSDILHSRPDIQVVAEAEDGLAAIHAVEKHKPDVVLMDISMPVINGIDATWVLKSKFPNVRVIVLTMHEVDFTSEEAFKAGAFWCLDKECSPNELIKTIRTAGV
jgi:two-component system nitrate/nitrite response regulator NarL